jgi:aminocarboxymuconate-semialdehyde decarboxylase
LKRCMLELGLRGVEVGTNVRGEYLGAEQFRPIFRCAQELGAVIRIHPVLGVGGNTRQQHYMWNSWANPVETSLTAAHMIMTGVMESFPELKVVLSHGGGTLPYQISRLDRSFVQRPEARQRISAPPSTYFKRFYFDTITHSKDALAYLLNLVGVDQIVLGSDYPFDMGHERPADIVAELGLSAEDQAKILGDNTLKLL